MEEQKQKRKYIRRQIQPQAPIKASGTFADGKSFEFSAYTKDESADRYTFQMLPDKPGTVVIKSIFKATIRDIVIEEPFVPQFIQQPQRFDGHTAPNPWAPPPQAPQQFTNPAINKKPILRSVVKPDGQPVSEVADEHGNTSLIPAGFVG